MEKSSSKTHGVRHAVLLWLVLSTILVHSSPADASYLIENPPSPAEVSRAVDLAAGYIERACGPDGKFIYEVNIAMGNRSGSYNVVRHAGAIYALGMYNRVHPDTKAVETMAKAANFMTKHYMGPGVRHGQLIIWSDPIDLRNTTDTQYAELGATALAVVALAELRKVRPDLVPRKELQRLGRALLFFQNVDGSFVHKYDSKGAPLTDWHSPYYSGEAALALSYLYEIDHSPEWLMASGRALSYLAKAQAHLFRVPADHWALIATAKLLPHCALVTCGISRSELIRHAAQICSSILDEQLSGTVLDGAFDPSGRTARAATRLEGLLSALEFLPHNELRQKIQKATALGIGFLLRAQITSGPNVGGIPDAYFPEPPYSSAIRIDYVQHALCAWIRYQQAAGLNQE